MEDVLLKVTYILLKSLRFGYCTFPAPKFEFFNLYCSEPLKERLYQNDNIKIQGGSVTCNKDGYIFLDHCATYEYIINDT